MSRLRASFRSAAILWATVATLAELVLLRLRAPFHPDRGGARADQIGQSWARTLARRMDLRIFVEGEAPEGPVAIVANHLGYLDIVALWCVVPGVFVARADVAHWPLVGVASRLIGTVFLDRARKRDLLRVIPELSSALAAGRNVIFFPEATSSPGVDVLPFRSSLFEAAARRQVPVVGVSLQFETPEPGPGADLAVCWWGDMPFASHVFALLALPRVVVRLRFSEPIAPSGDRKLLCDLAREAVIKKFIPTAASPIGEAASTGQGGSDR
ncbi:1-acyl-sn-glycerol-3-phosphate acyltransferase [Myxococcota bacterium]|nr:1-acyl-sn-glycerol-3-phosphate acyltransferase [Myxococcota bacterium]